MHGLSLAAASRGYSPVAGHGLLTVVAPLVAEPGSRRALQRAGSVVAVLRLSCSGTCEIAPDQRLTLCLLHWQADY